MIQEQNLSDLLSAIRNDSSLANWEKEKMCADVVHNYKEEHKPNFAKKGLDSYIHMLGRNNLPSMQTSAEKKAEDDKRAKEARKNVKVQVFIGNKLQAPVLRDKKGRIIIQKKASFAPVKVSVQKVHKKVLNVVGGVLYI